MTISYRWLVWVALGLWIGLATGCGASLQQARQQEKQGQGEQALRSYRAIARNEGHDDARKAQIAVVRLLLQQKKWRGVPGEASRLASFLDTDGPWYRRYRTQTTVWKQGRKEIRQTLLGGARGAFQQARAAGNPYAYIVAGRMYGLYLEHFAKGQARAEAAAGRGAVFAIRGDCAEAIRWFQRAMEWSPGLQATGDKMPWEGQPQDASSLGTWLVWQAVRGELGCRVRLWLENHAGTKELPRKLRALVPVLQSARSLTQRAPFLGGADILRQSLLLERAGAYAAALRLLLVAIQSPRSPRTSIVARQRALQLFGKSRNWRPMLLPLEKALDEIPEGKRSLFWKRVQHLSNLYRARKAQAMAQQKQGKAAMQSLLKQYRVAPQRRQMLLYRAALIAELNMKDAARALALYRKLMDKHPKHALVGKALFRSAQLLERNNKLRQAVRMYLRLGGHQPKHPIAARAFFQAFQLYRRLGQRRRATRMRRHILRHYPTSLAARRLAKMRRKRRRKRRRRR